MAAGKLRGRLPTGSCCIASAERKAQETLRLAVDDSFDVDRRLNEVRRPVEPLGGDVRPCRRAWVSGQLDSRHEGWETPTDAAARFDAVVRIPSNSQNVVVASHGMILTAWLVSVGILDEGESAALFWEALAFPDIVSVDLPLR
ncbi:histidine phosphatase family protein [Flexivirga caeni]|nr:histidine phosphatase family protein [Flexivirga caeni]